MARRTSRSARWMTAVEEARDAIERISTAAQEMDVNEIESAASDFEQAMQDLASVKEEYQEWYDNMPENLQQGATGEKLEAISQIDIESATLDFSAIQEAIQQAVSEIIDEAAGYLDEAESAELPAGFGRD